MTSAPRILIVNDDRQQAGLYMCQLEREGCIVDIAKSDIDAIMMLGCQHYDVAVIEVIDPLKTMSFYLTLGSKSSRERLIEFCQKINCEYVAMASGNVKPLNGHAVMDKADNDSLLAGILSVASHSLAL